MKVIIRSIILILLLSGCKFKPSLSSGVELKGEGITFLVPDETSTAAEGDEGITYDSATVKAKTDGKQLTVNGHDYGGLSRGDKVDLREKGKVLVNGLERKAASP